MMKRFILLLAFCLSIYLYASQVVNAQCVGSTNGACSYHSGAVVHTVIGPGYYTYNPSGFGTYVYHSGYSPNIYLCGSSTQSGAGFSCGHFLGGNTCGGCIPPDTYCAYTGGPYYYNNDCNAGGCTEYSGSVPDEWTNGADYNFCGGDKVCTSGCGYIPSCTNGRINCGAYGGAYGYPANSCYTNNAFHNRTCQHNGPQLCNNANFTDVGSTTVDNCNTGAGYTCSAQSCITNIFVHAFVDDDKNGSQNGSEADLNNVTVTDNGGNFPTTNLNGDLTFSGKTTGNYTITATVPFGYQNTTATSVAVALTNTDGNNSVSFGFSPNFIGGHVYLDYNHDGTNDAEDIGMQNVTVTDNGGSPVSTDANGAYRYDLIATGAHTIAITVPAGYTAVGVTSQNITLGNSTLAVDFYITKLYNISGRVYNDADSGNCYNPSGTSCTDNTQNPPIVHGSGIDTLYTTSSTTVTVVGTGVNQSLSQVDGTYDTGIVLRSGTYTVTFTNLPNTYHMTYPTSSVPPSFIVTVGTPGKSNACSTSSYNDATCDVTGDIANLGFGMNNEIPWHRGWCTDIRDESGTQNFIPDSPVCGTDSGEYTIMGNVSCVTGPGIYNSGTVTPDFGFSPNGPSQNGWLVGGATSESFSPVNPGVIRTSNSYIRTTVTNNGLPTYNLPDVCSNSSCYLPDNLPSGIYVWPFDSTFMGTFDTGTNSQISGTYTFPTGKNYVFIIGDNSHASSITFKTKIMVPNGSTVTFVSSKDIYIDPSIGEASVTSTAPTMEGFYSADRNFVIESSYARSNRCNDNGTTKDKRFNLIGSAIANAAGAGGTVENDRDLCSQDLSCPTYTIGNGDDNLNSNLGITYILNAPEVLKHKNFFWQELAP